MNQMKAWFLRTLALSLALLMLCTGIIVYADPFFHFRWDAEGEGVFFNQRYQNAGIARNSEADNVILGTSMVSNSSISTSLPVPPPAARNAISRRRPISRITFGASNAVTI